MSYSQAISLYQPLLYSIALKMVGSIQDAEDIVQDTFVKWLTQEKEKINNTKAYLVRSVTNNCINHLNAIKNKRVDYFENLRPGNLIEKYKEMDFSHLDLEKELQHALDTLHKKLAPVEKAAFILKDVFNVEYDELKDIVGKKADNCRKMVSRARQKISEYEFTALDEISIKPVKDQLLDSFRKACDTGDLTELIEDLTSKKPTK